VAKHIGDYFPKKLLTGSDSDVRVGPELGSVSDIVFNIIKFFESTKKINAFLFGSLKIIAILKYNIYILSKFRTTCPPPSGFRVYKRNAPTLTGKRIMK
jgi:hypothetical protein